MPAALPPPIESRSPEGRLPARPHGVTATRGDLVRSRAYPAPQAFVRPVRTVRTARDVHTVRSDNGAGE